MPFLSTELRLTRVVGSLCLIIAVLLISKFAANTMFRPASYALSPGMSKEQVRELMGPPELEMTCDDATEWHYHEGGRIVKLRFYSEVDQLDMVLAHKGHPFYSKSRS